MNDEASAPVSLNSFFGFQRHPFPPACAPEPLFRSDRIEAALQQAHNALQSRLHLLVTAPAGLGKSSFRRRGVDCQGTRVYAAKGRAERVRQLPAALRGPVERLEPAVLTPSQGGGSWLDQVCWL